MKKEVYEVTEKELKEFGISVKDYQVARLQYILQEISEVKHKKVPNSWYRIVIVHLGIHFDAVVRQKKYLPEPNDVELEFVITNDNRLVLKKDK
jgi:hypothetical protein